MSAPLSIAPLDDSREARETASAVRRLVERELERVGYAGIHVEFITDNLVTVEDLRDLETDSPLGFLPPAGRLLEELLDEPNSAGADAVLHAARRAMARRAPQPTTM